MKITFVIFIMDNLHRFNVRFTNWLDVSISINNLSERTILLLYEGKVGARRKRNIVRQKQRRDRKIEDFLKRKSSSGSRVKRE